MMIRILLAGIFSVSLMGGAYAAHGGGGGGGGGAKVSGGGGEGGGEAVALKKPVNKKKEFGCFEYLLTRSQFDPICRVLFDATQELSDMPGLKEGQHEKLREKLLETVNGLRYLKIFPDEGESTSPNWCELKRKILAVDEILKMEKKRDSDRKAEESEAKAAKESKNKD